MCCFIASVSILIYQIWFNMNNNLNIEISELSRYGLKLKVEWIDEMNAEYLKIK